MAVLEDGIKLEVLRSQLMNLHAPFLLRHYDATVRDYEELTDENLRCEYMDGVLTVHSPATLEHEDRMMFLGTLLNGFVSPRNLGRVFGSNAVMQLGQRRFCPDVSVLLTKHFERIRRGRVHGPVDLVVELISKSTRDYDLGDKRQAYRNGRVPEIWFVDHEARSWIVDSLHGRSYRSRTLSKGRFASHLLSGLSIDVTWLWDEPLPNPLECLDPKSTTGRRGK